MVTNEPFKVFQHNVRNTLTEEAYEGGMVFQDTPLDAGKNRLIVNYDIKEEGKTLTPRDGYVTTEVYADNCPFTEDNRLGFCYQSDISSEQNGIDYLRTIKYNKENRVSEFDFAQYKTLAAPCEFLYSPYKDGRPYKSMDDYGESVYSDEIGETPIPQFGIMRSGVTKINLGQTFTGEYSSYTIPRPDEEYKYGDIVFDEDAMFGGDDGGWLLCVKDGATGHDIHDETKWIAVGEDRHIYPLGKLHYFYSDEVGVTPIGCFAWEHAYYYFDGMGKINRVIFDDSGNIPAYRNETMEPKQVTSSEASQFGFNMLSRSPYEFYDSVSTGVEIMGVMLYRGTVTTFDSDASRKLVTKPRVNTLYTIRANYNGLASKNYDFTFYYKNSTDTEYTLIKKVENVSTTASAANPAYTTFQCPVETAIIKVEVSEHGAEEILDTLLVGILFSQSADESTANKDLQNYFLGDAAEMTFWKNRLWLSGLTQAPNILFASDVNDPTYFPYPNNIDVYDEPIIATIPFDENLMIFTTTKIIQLTLGENGWTNKVIQQNLNFNLEDKHFIQVVRNMLFFKSGNYFYMIVPRSLTVTKELALAPVSKNVTQFLDHLDENIKDTIEKLYGENVLHPDHHFNFVYNYVDYEDIHNIAVSGFGGPETGIFDFIYNTSDRTWRIYIWNSRYYPRIVRPDATNSAMLIMPYQEDYGYLRDFPDQRRIVVSEKRSGFQLVEKNKDYCGDIILSPTLDNRFRLNNIETGITTEERDYASVLQGCLFSPDEEIEPDMIHYDYSLAVGREILENYKIKNHQMLDTGYRDQNTGLNKRYRELQFKFNNASGKRLKFTTTFGIGGDARVQDYEYHVERSDEGEMYIERVPIENMSIPGVMRPMDISGNIELNTWELDGDSFPSIDFWKARMRVSGKGYVPRIILTCRTEEKYNLLGYAWVSHQLYAR